MKRVCASVFHLITAQVIPDNIYRCYRGDFAEQIVASDSRQGSWDAWVHVRLGLTIAALDGIPGIQNIQTDNPETPKPLN